MDDQLEGRAKKRRRGRRGRVGTYEAGSSASLLAGGGSPETGGPARSVKKSKEATEELQRSEEKDRKSDKFKEEGRPPKGVSSPLWEYRSRSEPRGEAALYEESEEAERRTQQEEETELKQEQRRKRFQQQCLGGVGQGRSNETFLRGKEGGGDIPQVPGDSGQLLDRGQ